MKRFFIVALLFTYTFVPAQNRILILQPGDSIGSILKLPENNGYGALDYHVPPTPMAVSGAFPFEVNFHNLANSAVNDFQLQHLEGYGLDEQYSLWLDAHFRILGSSDYEYTTSADWNEKGNRIKEVLCANKVLQEIIYAWLMPIYMKAFAAMSVPEQNNYLSVFKNALAYIASFDLEKEKAAADENGDFVYDRGKLNAFIYRRLSSNELTKDECVSWLNRIIKDFESVAKKAPLPADDYVLERALDYGYFIGVIYGQETQTGGGETILRKVNEQYTVLPGVTFDASTRSRHNLVWGPLEGSDSNGIFLYDSLGWHLTQTPYWGYPDDYVMLGDKNNQRIMFIEGWLTIPDVKTGSETVAMCTIVDADSGMILCDSVLIRTAITTGDDYRDVYSFDGISGRYIIYNSARTQLFGVMDRYGNGVLPPKYKSIEPTGQPNVFKVNGRKKIKIKD